MVIAATSETGILHDALAELGSTERPISVDDGTSKTALRAKTLWPGILRELTALHPWNHAIRTRLLNEAGETPAFAYERQFALPEDCVRWLPPARSSREFFRGERQGNYILTDRAAPLPCRYIALIDDVTQWAPAFVQLFMLRLALSLCEGVTQSEGIKDSLYRRIYAPAEGALAKAKRIDGLETGETRRANVVVQSDWLQARNRGSYGYGPRC